MFITFDFIDNEIEQKLPHTKFGLQNSNNIFTIIWVDPDAILQTFESGLTQERGDLVPFPSLLLGDIEDN